MRSCCGSLVGLVAFSQAGMARGNSDSLEMGDYFSDFVLNAQFVADSESDFSGSQELNGDGLSLGIRLSGSNSMHYGYVSFVDRSYAGILIPGTPPADFDIELLEAGLGVRAYSNDGRHVSFGLGYKGASLGGFDEDGYRASLGFGAPFGRSQNFAFESKVGYQSIDSLDGVIWEVSGLYYVVPRISLVASFHSERYEGEVRVAGAAAGRLELTTTDLRVGVRIQLANQ